MAKQEDIEYIKHLTRKNPVLSKKMVSFLEERRGTVPTIELFYSNYIKYKQLLKNKDFNIDDYKTIEKAEDALNDIVIDNQNKKFIYSFISSKYKNLIDDSVEREFLKIKELSLPREEIQDAINKIASYRKPEDLYITLNKFYKSKVEKNSLDSQIKKIESVNGANIVFVNRHLETIVSEVTNYQSCNKLGSRNWCISYSSNYFDSYVKPNNGLKRNRQLIVFDLKTQKDNLSKIGITLNSEYKHMNSHVKNDRVFGKHNTNKLFSEIGFSPKLHLNKYGFVLGKSGSVFDSIVEISKYIDNAKNKSELLEVSKMGNKYITQLELIVENDFKKEIDSVADKKNKNLAVKRFLEKINKVSPSRNNLFIEFLKISLSNRLVKEFEESINKNVFDFYQENIEKSINILKNKSYGSIYDGLRFVISLRLKVDNDSILEKSLNMSNDLLESISADSVFSKKEKIVIKDLIDIKRNVNLLNVNAYKDFLSKVSNNKIDEKIYDFVELIYFSQKGSNLTKYYKSNFYFKDFIDGESDINDMVASFLFDGKKEINEYIDMMYLEGLPQKSFPIFNSLMEKIEVDINDKVKNSYFLDLKTEILNNNTIVGVKKPIVYLKKIKSLNDAGLINIETMTPNKMKYVFQHLDNLLSSRYVFKLQSESILGKILLKSLVAHTFEDNKNVGNKILDFYDSLGSGSEIKTKFFGYGNSLRNSRDSLSTVKKEVEIVNKYFSEKDYFEEFNFNEEVLKNKNNIIDVSVSLYKDYFGEEPSSLLKSNLKKQVIKEYVKKGSKFNTNISNRSREFKHQVVKFNNFVNDFCEICSLYDNDEKEKMFLMEGVNKNIFLNKIKDNIKLTKNFRDLQQVGEKLKLFSKKINRIESNKDDSDINLYLNLTDKLDKSLKSVSVFSKNSILNIIKKEYDKLNFSSEEKKEFKKQILKISNEEVPLYIKTELLDLSTTFEETIENFLNEDFKYGDNNMDNKKMLIEKMKREVLRNKEELIQLVSEKDRKKNVVNKP